MARWISQKTVRHLRAGLSSAASFAGFFVGTLGGGALLVMAIFQPSLQAQSIIATATVCLLVVVLFVWTIWRDYHLSRKQKYASISHNCEAASIAIRELSAKLFLTLNKDEQNPQLLEAATHELCEVLDCVSSIFSMLTGTHCRATIKVIRTDNTVVWAHCLARDRLSTEQNAYHDRVRNDRKFDVIEKNIDFRLLFDPHTYRGCYINNDLARGQYESTSIEYRQQLSSHRWDPSAGDKWPLDYHSAMVWPICHQSENVIGFLAVDSDSRNVFEEQWDSAIGATIANQMFILLLLYQRVADTIKWE